MIVHTSQDTYRTDKVMEDEYKVLPLQLMEAAGKNVADRMNSDFSENPKKVLIITTPHKKIKSQGHLRVYNTDMLFKLFRNYSNYYFIETQPFYYIIYKKER